MQGGEGGRSTARFLPCARFFIQLRRREGPNKIQSRTFCTYIADTAVRTMRFFCTLPHMIGMELTIYHDTNSSSSSSSRAAAAEQQQTVRVLVHIPVRCCTCILPCYTIAYDIDKKLGFSSGQISENRQGKYFLSSHVTPFLRMRVRRIATGLSQLRRTRNENTAAVKSFACDW